MSHDWYATFTVESRQDVDALVCGDGRYAEVSDMAARASLLSTALGVEGRWPDAQGRPNRIEPKAYAQTGAGGQPSGLKALVHESRATDVGASRSRQLLWDLGIEGGGRIDILPPGSFDLRLPITLATPWLSRDDVGLYVIDNPVRKDPVFGVPTISPAGWKGMLRWSATRVCLEPLKDRPTEFARERAALTYLFGSEKGVEEEQPKDLAKYLDALCPAAAEPYRLLLRSSGAAGESEEETLLRRRGRLHCFPTFFDRIDMEVLNPHDRRAGAGAMPIYIESVPAGATGVFEILYVPWPTPQTTIAADVRDALADMDRVVRALQVLCLDLGISAKRSSGFGLVKDAWPESGACLHFRSASAVINRTFPDFVGLGAALDAIRREVEHG